MGMIAQQQPRLRRFLVTVYADGDRGWEDGPRAYHVTAPHGGDAERQGVRLARRDVPPAKHIRMVRVQQQEER